jgi:hypothetical protein
MHAAISRYKISTCVEDTAVLLKAFTHLLVIGIDAVCFILCYFAPLSVKRKQMMTDDKFHREATLANWQPLGAFFDATFYYVLRRTTTTSIPLATV